MNEGRKSRVGGWVTMCVLLGLGGVSIYFKPFAPGEPRPEEELTRGELSRIAFALRHYRQFAGCYPSEGQGLQVLVAQPEREPLPKRWEQILREVPRDGWGHEFRYAEVTESDEFELQLSSAGADGEFGTGDDLTGSRFVLRQAIENPTSTTNNVGINEDSHE